MGRNNASTQDYGRKPYLHQAVDETVGTTNNYREMMKSLTLAEVQRRREEKQSEFEKPYRRGMDYQEMQNLHPDNFTSPYSRRQFPPTGGEDGGIIETDCDTVWSNCLQQVCGNTTGCGGPGTVQQMRDCAGDCSKPNEDILSCLYYNSLCFCIECNDIGGFNPNSPISDCNIPYDKECQDLMCANKGKCSPFVLEGSDSCPAYLCPTAEICAIDIVGGDAIGKCVYIPCEGCGTKTITVTDICGNVVTKQVRMAAGAWYNLGQTCIPDAYGCVPNPDYPTSKTDCFATLIMCTEITGAYKYVNYSGNSFTGSGIPCPKCPNNQAYSSYFTYEWRC